MVGGVVDDDDSLTGGDQLFDDTQPDVLQTADDDVRLRCDAVPATAASCRKRVSAVLPVHHGVRGAPGDSGNPAATQASKPPTTSVAGSPSDLSESAANDDVYPSWQMTIHCCPATASAAGRRNRDAPAIRGDCVRSPPRPDCPAVANPLPVGSDVDEQRAIRDGPGRFAGGDPVQP